MDEPAGIYAREASYLERYVQIGMASGRVIAVSFPQDPAADADPEHGLLDRIVAYLEGAEDDFAAVPVALTLPTDQGAALEAVREVPYGDQVSVEELTRMTPGLDADDETDRDLVRTALADNPAPLVVPDHRVRDGPSGAPPEVEQRLRTLEGL